MATKLLLHRREAAVERVRRHDRRRAGDQAIAWRGRGAAAGVSATDGFSGGRLAACLVSGFGAGWVFGAAASWRGGLGALGLDHLRLGGRRRRAGGGVGRGRRGRPCGRGWRRSRRTVRVGAAMRPASRGGAGRGAPQSGAAGASSGDRRRLGARRIDVGREWCRARATARPATGPGRRRLRTGRYRPRARLAANTLFMPPSMPVLIRATGVPFAISLAVSARPSAASRARRRRCPRGSRRPGIWPKHRTPARAWRSAP